MIGTMPYFRCVFSAAGFCEAVYYLVNEYNAIHENKIFLYHRDDVKGKFNKLYSSLHSTISRTEHKPDVTITQMQWVSKSGSTKTSVRKDILQQYCKDRGIPFSNEAKDKLIRRLDKFDLKVALK